MGESLERATIAKISRRVVPFIGLLYVVNYIDRINLSFAALTMNKAIGLDSYYYGLGAGVFFFGYFIFEVPSNIIVEGMQAMMQSEKAVAPRLLTAEEAVAEELRRRHGERALLIEARTGGDGSLRMLAVLDLDRDALAAEAERLAARGDGAMPAIEVVDRATWLTMRRLAATGMLRFADQRSRILHRAPELAAADSAPVQPERAVELRTQAERGVRMALVLSAGGFPEEAPPILAKALYQGAAARLSELGELAAEASLATSEEMQRLVVRGALPAEAMTLLAALPTANGAHDVDDVAHLAASTARILATLGSPAGAPVHLGGR
jgi:hypothetical protein